MNAKTVLHSFIIIASTALPGLWISSPLLEPYTLQACGALTLVYIASKKVLRVEYQGLASMLFTNALVQTLIISTGRTSSPLFFLYYFVLFAFAVIFERYLVFLVTITTLAVHLYLQPSVASNFDQGATNLFSLLLITPLADFYSKAVLKNIIAKEKIRNLQEDLSQTETDSLLWLSTENKPTLNQVISSVTDLIIYLKSTRSEINFPVSFLNKMKSIQSDLMTLYSSADLLEDNLKSKTDNS